MIDIQDWSQPQSIDNIDVVFPAGVDHLMPKYEDIPDDFKSMNFSYASKDLKGPELWLTFQSAWFFKGIDKKSIKPKKGIDLDRAIRHLAAIQGSWEPKHEHKMAAVAYLASLWFEKWKQPK